jgi:hypothetical protein
VTERDVSLCGRVCLHHLLRDSWRAVLGDGCVGYGLETVLRGFPEQYMENILDDIVSIVLKL